LRSHRVAGGVCPCCPARPFTKKIALGHQVLQPLSILPPWISRLPRLSSGPGGPELKPLRPDHFRFYANHVGSPRNQIPPHSTLPPTRRRRRAAKRMDCRFLRAKLLIEIDFRSPLPFFENLELNIRCVQQRSCHQYVRSFLTLDLTFNRVCRRLVSTANYWQPPVHELPAQAFR